MVIRKSARVWFCAALVAVLALFIGAASAEMQMEAAIGYNGAITYCRMLPLNVTLTNDGADESGLVRIDLQIDSTQYDRYEAPATVASGATVNVTLPVFLSKKQDSYRVQWVVDDIVKRQIDIKASDVITPSSFIVGVLSGQPQIMTYLNITKSSDPLSRGEYWQTVALTPETFPADVASMRFFDALAVDGVDLSLMNARQQEAFEAWLQSGGIVLLGGGGQAGASFPYFTRYTGITAGEVADNEDPSKALMTLFQLSVDPLGQNVTTVGLEGASGIVLDDLADVTRVKDGYVFTAAFSLSDKPFSSWQGRNVLWQRMLIKYAQPHYVNIMEDRDDFGPYSSVTMTVDNSGIDNLSVENGSGMVLPMILLAVFVALSGFGAYFLLKKLDRREWMWLTVPVLAIVFSLIMWGLSGALGLKRPIVLSYTIAEVDKEGRQSHATTVKVAQADTGRINVSMDNGNVDMLSSFVSYYNDTDEKGAPLQLRYQYRVGERVSFSLPASSSWQSNRFVLQDVPIADCRLSGECALNDGRIDIVVRNDSDIVFEHGVMMSDYGFVTVPTLLPGQSASVSLVPPQDTKKAAEIMDGVMLTDTQRREYVIYSFSEKIAPTPANGLETELERLERMTRRAVLDDIISISEWNNVESRFLYVGFCDTLAEPHIYVDGSDDIRAANRGAVYVDLKFNPVSADGTLHFLNGSFPVHIANINDKGVPSLGDSVSLMPYYSYYSLSASPSFAFDLSSLPKNIEMTSMKLVVSYSYNSYKAELYNQNTGEWDIYMYHDYNQMNSKSTTRTRQISLDDYLDEQGMLYVRFLTHKKVDSYAEMSTPGLTLDGRTK